MSTDKSDPPPIPALLPRAGTGHQFVLYADACSGVPGAPHEATFAATNATVARLRPRPEFICFPGDEIQGLLADDAALRAQWRYWLDQELSWLDPAIPRYHTTGNHTTYDAASEAIFREALPGLPRNGPPGQEGLAYWIRRGDLLLVAVNTLWSGGGGEGRVETAWLDRTLAAHADAHHKLVIGHHPIFSINGFAGAFQREVAPDDGAAFWRVLVRHGVAAYLCSHMLAFDVQAHDGVLQIMSAGAGTAHLMPPETEYLHCVQVALDAAGLRYQTLDTDGAIREWLSWPLPEPRPMMWQALAAGTTTAPALPTPDPAHPGAQFVGWRFAGSAAPTGTGAAQTLLAGWNDGPGLATLWIGLLGSEGRLGVLLSPQAGRSPHLWHGPTLEPGAPFAIEVAFHTGMGPGGILWRRDERAPWSSLTAASSWGAERIPWPHHWALGHDRRGAADRPFRGELLRGWWRAEALRLA